MLTNKMVLAGIALILPIADGCKKQATARSATPATGVSHVSAATAWYMCRAGRSVLVVWIDTLATPSGEGTESELTVPTGATVPIKCDAPDSTTGTASIDGKTYDLSKGSVFLIRTRKATPDVTQLAKHLPEMVCGDQAMKSLAQTDGDIAAFVKDARPPGGERRFN
jgi:hypothetical protein